MKNDHTGILKNYRNDWYNEDYLNLLADRFNLSKYNNILDVGCGKFHWARIIGKYFKQGANITGIDIATIEKSYLNELSKSEELSEKTLTFINGSAEKLPFENNSFDFVTCQTLLIHMKNPKIVIKEMYRVLKPDGVILISEPNNLSQAVFRDSLFLLDKNKNSRIKNIKSRMKSEHNKSASLKGDNSLGEIIPILLREEKFKNIRCFINDKIIALYPPYDKNDQIRKIDMLKNLKENYPFKFSKHEKKQLNKTIESIEEREFSSFCPTMLFITYAEKTCDA